MMKAAPLLCALWACGPLTLGASAAGSTTPGPDKRVEAGRPAAQGSIQAGSSKGDDSKARNAAIAAPRSSSVILTHAAGHFTRSNADRLHALHPAKARARMAPSANRRVGPNAAAGGGNAWARGRALPGVSPLALPMPPVATKAARVPASVMAMVQGSMIGGPRAAAPGRLGGPASTRTGNNTAIDGTQLHKKF